MYPIKFQPIYKERLWGGDKLQKLFGRTITSAQVGESWELACHKNGMSIVSNGFLQGKTLQELMVTYKQKLLGSKYTDSEMFPLLIKIIDANDKLSIQVHPGDNYNKLEENESGKTEAWYVLSASPDAKLIYGLKETISKTEFLRALQEGTILETVRTVPVKYGDMIFVPAGLVHALLEGVVVCEVQQNSDTTYRLYDFDRIGTDGKKRDLHINQALDIINFNNQPSTEFSANKIDCKYFCIEKLTLQGKKQDITNGQFVILFTASGSGKIYCKECMEEIVAGETILIPACLDEFSIQGNMEYIKIM